MVCRVALPGPAPSIVLVRLGYAGDGREGLCSVGSMNKVLPFFSIEILFYNFGLKIANFKCAL